MNRLVLVLIPIILFSALAADEPPPISSEYINTMDQLDKMDKKLDSISDGVSILSSFSTRLHGLDAEITNKVEGLYTIINSVVGDMRNKMLFFSIILLGLFLICMGSISFMLYNAVQKAIEHYTKVELEPALFRILNTNYYTTLDTPSPIVSKPDKPPFIDDKPIDTIEPVKLKPLPKKKEPKKEVKNIEPISVSSLSPVERSIEVKIPDSSPAVYELKKKKKKWWFF